MGFTPERTIYNLVFDAPEFEGLHIRVRAASMRDRMHAWFDLSWETDDNVDTRRDKQYETFQMFIDHVVDWNLQYEDGTPVPVTVDGLVSVCEPHQVGAIMGAWNSGRTTVAAPLEPPSPDIELSDIPMTVLAS